MTGSPEPHPEEGAGPVQLRAGADERYSVDARGGMGVQVGEGNTQIIYTYNSLTWTDGVASPPLVSVSGVIDSPYRGLGSFKEQDAALFYGREAATTRLLERLSRQLKSAGLVVVSGVSGAGKSSLLQAGMLPRIRGSGLAGAPGSTRWRYAEDWRPTRLGSRSPPARPPSRRRPDRDRVWADRALPCRSPSHGCC
jgi:hypothetical protein